MNNLGEMKIKYFEDGTLYNSYQMPYRSLAAWLLFISHNFSFLFLIEGGSFSGYKPSSSLHSSFRVTPQATLRYGWGGDERAVRGKEQYTGDFLPGHLLLAFSLVVQDQEEAHCDFHCGFL